MTEPNDRLKAVREEQQRKAQEDAAKRAAESKRKDEEHKAARAKEEEAMHKRGAGTPHKPNYHSSSVAKVTTDKVVALSDHVGEGEVPAHKFEGKLNLAGKNDSKRGSAKDSSDQRTKSSSVVKVREDGTVVVGDNVRDDEKVLGHEEETE
jgi:hypothetical protein